jgi:hypothetical protein
LTDKTQKLEAQLSEARDEIARLRFGPAKKPRVLPMGYSEIMAMRNGQKIRVSFPNGYNL